MFWSKAKEFLEEDIETDRRQSGVVHAAKATSERDFRQQVQQRCPPDTPIPSDEWIRLQFVPDHTKLLQSTQVVRKLKSTFSKGSGGRSMKTPIMGHVYLNIQYH